MSEKWRNFTDKEIKALLGGKEVTGLEKIPKVWGVGRRANLFRSKTTMGIYSEGNRKVLGGPLVHFFGALASGTLQEALRG